MDRLNTKGKKNTDLSLRPLRVGLSLPFPFPFDILSASFGRSLLRRRFRLNGEEPIQPPLLFGIQEFCELFRAFAYAVFTVLWRIIDGE